MELFEYWADDHESYYYEIGVGKVRSRCSRILRSFDILLSLLLEVLFVLGIKIYTEVGRLEYD